MIAQKSKMAKKETLERKWYVVDADGKVLGRLATRLARLIMGLQTRPGPDDRTI